jgi:hypothetical protein
VVDRLHDGQRGLDRGRDVPFVGADDRVAPADRPPVDAREVQGSARPRRGLADPLSQRLDAPHPSGGIALRADGHHPVSDRERAVTDAPGDHAPALAMV